MLNVRRTKIRNSFRLEKEEKGDAGHAHGDADQFAEFDALVEEDSPGKSLNTSMFTMAIIALVILAIIVAVVLLLARRNR